MTRSEEGKCYPIYGDDFAKGYRVPLPCWTCMKDVVNDPEIAQRYRDAGMKDRYCPTGGYHPQELYEEMKIDLMRETLKKVVEAFDELDEDIIIDTLTKEKEDED